MCSSGPEKPENSEEKNMPVIKDAVCSLCGSLCDDITVTVEDNKITKIENACILGHSKFVGMFEHDRIETPMVRKDGELVPVSYEEAIEAAAKILVNSRRTLSYGWCSTSCEAVSGAIQLAEETGSIIDSTANVCHGPTALAAQEKGSPSASLGEIKNRADVIVFWGCNPVHAHPRHMSRYSSFSKGFFTEKGRKGRKMVVIDVRKTDTAKIADKYVEIEQGSDLLLVTALRSIVNGHEDVVPETVAGVPKAEVLELAETLKNAKFTCIFFGMGVTQSRSKYKNGDAVSSLISDLNQHTKAVMIGMRGHYNVTGFGQVATWETGFPMAIDFSRGYPYYNPGETGANDLLVREEPDAAIIAAADAGAHFPQKAVRHLARIPVIQIDPYANPTTEIADVVIPAAVVGIEAEGTAYRMDAISLRMKKLIDTEFKTDEEIVKDLTAKVREMKRGV
ncbi:Formylmethanofuran dehydrogenase subunit B [Methanosarcina mazei S-6]|jgi:formylmethanofuran dehydrogenase subunit B|uniref:Formylmethanofuran dehydrogenase subunit B n=6 Tax=Methanosarcina mazei TaxID=2209 RepID=A0A0E3LUU8_METMZ|nr:Formylmethanofuran dehydrogenase subunit B [Methanosarcina mazei SarPi]AKB65896.1 Formylmethanofuran dehydrogenase subunit B [Methanosarcina mazei S-6]AKB68965.1 Formylmethanofuran dehydrogenase subunit B [Methanosarcina mazei LYC]